MVYFFRKMVLASGTYYDVIPQYKQGSNCGFSISMSVTNELSKALDALKPLKRKVLGEDSNSGKRQRRSLKGNALDYDSFYSRLSTYRPGNWNSFHPLSPLHAASWGWAVSEGGDATLHCVSCRGSLMTSLPKRSLPSVFHKSANILKGRLNTSLEQGGAHVKFCPWLVAHCPEIFQEILLASQLTQPHSSLKETFTKEWILPLTQLTRLGSVPFIPRATRPNHSPSVFKVLRDSFPSLLNLPEENECTLESLFALALCGWQRKSDFIIQCKLCQREVGLWNVPSTTDEASLEREGADIRQSLLLLEEEEKLQKEIEREEETPPVDEHSDEESNGGEEVESGEESVEEESPLSSSEEDSIDDDEEGGDEGTIPSPEYSEDSEQEAEEQGSESDSDVIEIISSDDDDEVIRGDDEEDHLHLEEDSVHSSSEELEVDEEEHHHEEGPSKSFSENEEENAAPKKNESIVDKSGSDEDSANASLPSHEKSSESEEAENVDLNSIAPETKTKEFFNPLSQHQPWCPWINKGPCTQRTGYETVLFILEHKLTEEGRRISRGVSETPNVHDKMKKMLSVLESIVN